MINLFLISLIIVIPALLPIIFIHKITKNYENKKRVIINMFSIAFFIPLVNFIYFCYSEIYLNSQPPDLYPYFIGLFWLLIILPILFIITLLIPKQKFQYKKYTLLTIFLTELLGWIFVFVALAISNWISTNQTLKGLREYQPTIHYIKKYKNEHAIYPTTLNKNLISAKIFPYYEYKTYNNRNDFSLKVSDYEHFVHNYNYCSNKNLDGCNEKSKNSRFVNYRRIDEWIEETFDFD